MKTNEYFKPKSLVYTGKYQNNKTKFQQFIYDENKFEVHEELQQDQLQKSYIQVVGLNDVKRLEEIQKLYKIEPFIMEDVLNTNQRNKFEYTDKYIFTSLNVLCFDKERQIKKDYFSMIYIENTVITFHETEPIYLEPLIPLLKDYMELKSHSVDLLFYHILDIITDEHLEVFDDLDQSMNGFEEEILESKELEQEAFYVVRKRMLQLKNIVSPMFEQIDQLISRKLPIISSDHQSHFDDLKDHLQRLDSKLNQSRDMMRQLLDLHMNNQSTKMNQVMSTLTLFSAIFIPLSFLTGYFGMNFHDFGILAEPYAVIIFTAIIILIAIGMLMFFKRKKWF